MQYQTSLIRGQPDNEAIKMIQYFEGLAVESDSRGYCVCSSEGKDSRVLGHLFRRAKVKHFYAHSITGIDPPELVYFQRKNFEEYKSQGYLAYDLWYKKSIWQMMREKLAPPMRISRYCCAELKESRRKETDGCILSFGVRKQESVRRSKNRNEMEIVANGRRGMNIIMPYDDNKNRRTFETCYTDNEKRLNPVAYWTIEDIWEYSKDVKLEQCCLYQEGFKRLGCVGCPMSVKSRKKEFARWQGIERLWRKSFDDMHKLRVEKGKSVNQSSGQEWFEWWLNDWTREDVDEEQENLF